jgi:hypothetical protein
MTPLVQAKKLNPTALITPPLHAGRILDAYFANAATGGIEGGHG